MGHSSVCEINKIVARSLMRNFTVGKCSVQFSSVTQSCPTLCDLLVLFSLLYFPLGTLF